MDSFFEWIARNRILRWVLLAPVAIVVYVLVIPVANFFVAFGNSAYGIHEHLYRPYTYFFDAVNTFIFFDLPTVVAAGLAAGYVAVTIAPSHKRETWLVFSAVASTCFVLFGVLTYIALVRALPEGAIPWWIYLYGVAKISVQCASLFGGGYKAYQDSLS